MFCFLLTISEVGARLIFPKEDKLGQILCILEQDQVLFWRQKANLKVRFQGVEVKTNFLGLRDLRANFKKTKNTFRIVCLGASPTFGWAVKYEDTYPYQLERMLRSKGGEEKVYEVINAGVIGYTSYQGLLFLKKEILRLSPDIISVPYVINDIDRDRFYRSNGKSDKELKPKDSRLLHLENLLEKSKLFRIWRKIALQTVAVGVKFLGTERNHLGAVRISPQEYENNLNEIIAIARQNGVKVVFIKMPVSFFPHEELPEKKKHFQETKDRQLFQCGKDVKVYNEIIESVAEKNEVPLVDIALAFAENKAKNLFITPIHPSASGHKIIAAEVYNTLLKYDLLSNDYKNK